MDCVKSYAQVVTGRVAQITARTPGRPIITTPPVRPTTSSPIRDALDEDGFQVQPSQRRKLNKQNHVISNHQTRGKGLLATTPTSSPSLANESQPVSPPDQLAPTRSPPKTSTPRSKKNYKRKVKRATPSSQSNFPSADYVPYSKPQLPKQDDLPQLDKTIDYLAATFDGFKPTNDTTRGPGSYGFTLSSGKESILCFGGKLDFSTNNTCEYSALITLLSIVHPFLDSAVLPVKIEIAGDSWLVISQVLGYAKCRSPHLLDFLIPVKDLIKNIKKHPMCGSFVLFQMKRVFNQAADHVANLAFKNELDGFYLKQEGGNKDNMFKGMSIFTEIDPADHIRPPRKERLPECKRPFPLSDKTLRQIEESLLVDPTFDNVLCNMELLLNPSKPKEKEREEKKMKKSKSSTFKQLQCCFQTLVFLTPPRLI